MEVDNHSSIRLLLRAEDRGGGGGFYLREISSFLRTTTGLYCVTFAYFLNWENLYMTCLPNGGIELYHRFDKALPVLLICIALQQSCVVFFSAVIRNELIVALPCNTYLSESHCF